MSHPSDSSAKSSRLFKAHNYERDSFYIKVFLFEDVCKSIKDRNAHLYTLLSWSNDVSYRAKNGIPQKLNQMDQTICQDGGNFSNDNNYIE